MCALIVKSARDMWVAAGNPPRYRYVFLRTQWGISPDIDAKLDLMPEGHGGEGNKLNWRTGLF